MAKGSGLQYYPAGVLSSWCIPASKSLKFASWDYVEQLLMYLLLLQIKRWDLLRITQQEIDFGVFLSSNDAHLS